MSASLPKVNKAQNKQLNEDSSFPPENKIINCKLTSNVITTRTLHIYMKQKKKKNDGYLYNHASFRKEVSGGAPGVTSAPPTHTPQVYQSEKTTQK